MPEVLLDKSPAWVSGTGPESLLAIRTRGILARNLGDIPFVALCSDDEKRAVEERVLSVLESLNLLSSGQYCSLVSLDPRQARILIERQLASESLVRGTGPRGVYVSNDQTLSISVNDGDHLRIQVISPGLQPQEALNKLNNVDNILGVHLDYAFDGRLGYLTSELARLGTGLKLDVLLHLPGLTMLNRLLSIEQFVRDQHHIFEGFQGPLMEARGDLFVLQNRRTLGRSEEETAFHVKHLATDLLTQEKAARQTLMAENLRTLEDRVGRALGIARGAKLLEYDEALSLLSSLRLGLALDLVNGFTVQQLNQMAVAAQRAHIEAKKSHDCDDLTLSVERSDMFRARFA